MRLLAFIRRWGERRRSTRVTYEWKIQPDRPGEMADQPVTVIPSMPGPVTCFVYVKGKLAKRTFMGAKVAIDRADPIPAPGPPVDFCWNGDEYIAVARKEEPTNG